MCAGEVYGCAFVSSRLVSEMLENPESANRPFVLFVGICFQLICVCSILKLLALIPPILVGLKSCLLRCHHRDSHDGVLSAFGARWYFAIYFLDKPVLN